jgi:hypothetical protein
MRPSIVVKVAIALAVVAVAALMFYHKEVATSLGDDIFGLTYQFLLLVVIGGAVTLLFSQYSREQTREQERRAEERAIQREFHADLIQTYNAAKRIKRLLQARARSISRNEEGEEVTVIEKAPYDEQMQALIAIQLQFESLADEAKSNPDLFSGIEELKDLPSYLKNMGEYLHCIVNEYEDSYRLFSSDSLLAIEKLPELREFISTPHHKERITKFRDPAYKAIAGLQKLLTSK